MKKIKEEYSLLTEQVRDLDRCMQKILGKTYTFEDKRTAHFLFSSIREHAKVIMLELIFINNKDQDQLQQERTRTAPGKELALLKLRCQHYERKVNDLQQRARAIEEQVIQAKDIFIKLAREVEDREQEERTKHCTTCQGKGWIHTFSTEIPKEGSDRCPDCKPKEG